LIKATSRPHVCEVRVCDTARRRARAAVTCVWRRVTCVWTRDLQRSQLTLQLVRNERASSDTEDSVVGECGQLEERARWAHTIYTLARAEGKRMHSILPSAVADFPSCVGASSSGTEEQRPADSKTKARRRAAAAAARAPFCGRSRPPASRRHRAPSAPAAKGRSTPSQSVPRGRYAPLRQAQRAREARLARSTHRRSAAWH
jgi:hypothetical protein